MFTFVVVMIVALLVVGVVYDVISRRRGSYRSSAEWLAMSRRRRSHFRQDPAGDARPKSDR